VRAVPNQAIITAHRSPFGGYTKAGEFVVTRTTDGRRLPVPQLARINPLPPPAQSALKKSSTVSIESGDSYTLITTPESASSAGSVNGGSNSGLFPHKSMFARLMGRSHRKTLSAPIVPSDIDVARTAAKKAVRFTIEGEEAA